MHGRNPYEDIPYVPIRVAHRRLVLALVLFAIVLGLGLITYSAKAAMPIGPSLTPQQEFDRQCSSGCIMVPLPDWDVIKRALDRCAGARV